MKFLIYLFCFFGLIPLLTGCPSFRTTQVEAGPRTLTLAQGDSTVYGAFHAAVLQFSEGDRNDRHFGDTLIGVARLFLGRPYEARTLDRGNAEVLVLNLNSFDCTTLVEQVLALGKTLRNKDRTYQDWSREVESLRYREGNCNGYESRLHYFSEWLTRAEAAGKVQYPVAGTKTRPEARKLNFMGTHRSLYPRLSADSVFQSIQQRESLLEQQMLYRIPLEDIASQSSSFRNGDIVAFVTSIDGLDVTHTGLVVNEGGETRLLHASTSGSVSISERLLEDYARSLRNCTGILLARPH